MRGASWWQATPLLVALAAMVVAVIVGWRQVRYSMARTITIEQDRQMITMSRQVVAYLVFVPAFFAAGVVFQALASAPPAGGHG
jgi:membrane protein insertase Oxa1/YidC/SpoIIIJ